MNDLMLSFLCLFHVSIWLFVIFGGFWSPEICKFNMLVIVPTIYLLHMLSFHVIVSYKLDHILKNCDNFQDIDYYVKPKCIEDFKKYLPDNIDNKKALKIIKIYFSEEDKLVIPRIYKKIEGCFENSFANPLSAQGMLILAMIVSAYLLKFYWKEF